MIQKVECQVADGLHSERTKDLQGPKPFFTFQILKAAPNKLAAIQHITASNYQCQRQRNQ